MDIDELLAPTIILLNQKGYKTQFCCSSHWYEQDLDIIETYIKFEDGTNIPFLPDEFTWDVIPTPRTIGRTIRRIYSATSDSSLFEFGLESAGILYRWAQRLPPQKRSGNYLVIG